MTPKKNKEQESVLPAFDEQVKALLDHYDDFHWMGEHSPLASVYFLGEAIANKIDLDTPARRGQALRAALDKAALTLWSAPLPKTYDEMRAALERERQEPGSRRFAYLVLEVRHFRCFFKPRTNQAIWEEYLLRSKSQHYRDYDLAVGQLGQALLGQLRPTLRAELPTAPIEMFGYQSYLTQAVAQLTEGRSVSIIGGSGIGKSTLGAAIAQQIRQTTTRSVFWYTLRPGLNDRLESLLFALGHFLYEQGATTLWQVLLAGPNTPDLAAALTALWQDLAQLTENRPVLCFDELDHLARIHSEALNSAYIQLAEALDSLRPLTPLLLIGHYAILEADTTLTPPGLQSVQITQLFANEDRPLATIEAEQLFRYTQGNPRLLHFCRVLYRNGETINTFAHTSTTIGGFYPVLHRLWRRLPPGDKQLLQKLAVFNAPIAEALWATEKATLQRLLDYRLIIADQNGGIEVAPILRTLIYQEVLSPEQRLHLHQVAATYRQTFGEYTAAAWHYWQAQQNRAAIALWYPKMDSEIKRGQAAVAYAFFSHMPNQGLPGPESKALALIQAELLRLRGDWESGLARLATVHWADQDEIDAKAAGLRAEFLEALGHREQALPAYDQALAIITRLQGQMVYWQQQRGLLHLRQANLPQAKQGAKLAECLTLELVGTIQKEEGQLDEALLSYQKAALLAENLQETTRLARLESYIFHIYGYRRDLSKVEAYARSAIRHYQAIHDLGQAAKVQYDLGGAYIECGHLAQGIHESLQALIFFEEAKAPYHIANICVNLAQGYLQSNNLTTAEHYARRALDQEEPEALPYAYWCLGKIKAEQGDLASAHRCFDIVLDYPATQPYIAAFAHKEIALLYLQQQKRSEGKRACQKALQLFEELRIHEEVVAIQALIPSFDH